MDPAMLPKDLVALKNPITRFFCLMSAWLAIMSWSTGTLTEYPAYTRTPNPMSIPIPGETTVPRAATAHTEVRHTMERFVSVPLMIQIHRVMLETKEMRPTAALMIPL